MITKIMLLCVLLLSLTVNAKESVYTWKVNSIQDDNTIKVKTLYFPKDLGNIIIQIDNVDIPETTKARCPNEAVVADQARTFLRNNLEGRTIIVSKVRHLDQSNYINANVKVDVGNNKIIDVGDVMVTNGFAHASLGSVKTDWCLKN